MVSKLVLEYALSYLPFSLYRQIMGEFDMNVSNYMGIIIDPIRPSTITVGGQFNNIKLHEKDDINKFSAEEPIVKIGSNYGEHFAPGFVEPEKKPKTSKRGRKPKEKKPKTRNQGNGKYFNSQITFVFRSYVNPEKLYKFKIFRNGQFQVPGVLNTDQNDIMDPLNYLKDYFSKIYKTNCDVVDKVIQMRNCKTILTDSDLTINTIALGAIIKAESLGKNEIGIYSVEYQTAQNSSKVVVKFLRPTKDKAIKLTTLKILKQKINFEGAVSFEGVDEIYWWLNDLLLDNYDRVINDPTAAVVDSDSSDTEQEESDADDDDFVRDEEVKYEDFPDRPTKAFAFDPYEF